MQKITPHLWFDKQGEEAVDFYTSIFKNSKKGEVSHYGKEGFEIHGMPEGTVLTAEFEVEGYKLIALNGGPHFKFNPSISFHVKLPTKEEVDALWAKLLEGGTVLMELGEYPFSERYGWLQDKYGLSWQLIFAGGQEIKQAITPVLMFVGDVCGKAEEAVNLYTSVFRNSTVEMVMKYGKGEEPDKEGTVKYTSFSLEGQEFGAMDSAHKHNFAFNEAISFMVSCKDQKEIDYFWEKLSAVPESEQCGWLKDRYGVSWQIVPEVMGKLMSGPNGGKVMEALLKMKKLVIDDLNKAAEGK